MQSVFASGSSRYLLIDKQAWSIVAIETFANSELNYYSLGWLVRSSLLLSCSSSVRREKGRGSAGRRSDGTLPLHRCHDPRSPVPVLAGQLRTTGEVSRLRCCRREERPPLHEFVRRNDRTRLSEVAGNRVRQLQQTPTFANLSERHEGGLVKLFAANLLERRLPNGGPEFPDVR